MVDRFASGREAVSEGLSRVGCVLVRPDRVSGQASEQVVTVQRKVNNQRISRTAATAALIGRSAEKAGEVSSMMRSKQNPCSKSAAHEVAGERGRFAVLAMQWKSKK